MEEAEGVVEGVVVVVVVREVVDVVKMVASDWFFKFFIYNIINNIMCHTNEYTTNKEVNQWTKVTSHKLQV
jgi:hypothetical protein